MTAHLGDFRNRQKRRHREQCQERQHGRFQLARPHQHGTGRNNRQTAKARHHIEQFFLKREIREKWQPDPVVIARSHGKLFAPAIHIIKRNHFSEPLNTIDRMRV